MKITNLQVKNFRGKDSMDLSFEKSNAFTGKCGSGKTTIMKALQFALTGTYDKEDIRFGKGNASVIITFEDGSTASRVRVSDGVECRADGKKCTGTALNDYIESKIGANAKVIDAMCSAEFFESIEQKDLTKFILSILPVKISFEKLIDFLNEMKSKPVSEKETDFLKKYFSEFDTFGLAEIETVYKKVFEERKCRKRDLQNMQGKTVFNGTLPAESREDLQKEMGEISLIEAKSREYMKNLDAYNKSVKAREEAEKKKAELQKELESYSNMEKPSEEALKKDTEDKKKFEEAIKKANNVIATCDANVRMFRKTLDNLDKPVCPVSEKLVCTTDKSGLKADLSKLVEENEGVIRERKDFIVKCNEQIEKRNMRIEAYNKNAIAFTKKQGLEAQLKNLVIPEILQKPEEVKTEDIGSRKALINQKLQIISEYEVSEKAKKEMLQIEEEVKMLEFSVKALDVKNGVRSKIMEKTLAPLQEMIDGKAGKINDQFKVMMSSAAGLEIKISTDGGNNFIPMKSVSSGEFIIVAYLIMSVINEITGVKVILLDNLDKLDEETFKSLFELLINDSGYDSIFISAVNHDDIQFQMSKGDIKVFEM